MTRTVEGRGHGAMVEKDGRVVVGNRGRRREMEADLEKFDQIRDFGWVRYVGSNLTPRLDMYLQLQIRPTFGLDIGVA